LDIENRQGEGVAACAVTSVGTEKQHDRHLGASISLEMGPSQPGWEWLDEAGGKDVEMVFSMIVILGGGNSNIFGIFIPKFGEDEPILTDIFQMGWFNHQPGYHMFSK